MSTVAPNANGSGPPPAAVLLYPNDGCLTIARALVRRGVRVHVLAHPRSAYVTRSRGVEGRVLAHPSERPDQWIAALNEIRGPGVLIAGADDACELLVRHRAEIPAALRSFEGPQSAHLELMDKARLYERAKSLGIRIPWVRSVSSPAEVGGVVAEAAVPCVAKPALSHVGKSAGDYGAVLVESRQELAELLSRAAADGVEMLVTEHVPGGEDELEGAVIIRAPDGSYPLVYGRRKVRQYPLDFGPGSLTRSAAVPETVEITKRICDSAGYAGVASLEVKRHAGSGERVLIEINVRVVQSFGLGDACGVDASWRLYATLAGIPLGPQPPQRDGRAVVSPGFDLLAVRQRLRRGDVTLPEVIRSYRGTRDVSVLDLRDPRPGLALGAFFVRSKLEKRRRRVPA